MTTTYCGLGITTDFLCLKSNVDFSPESTLYQT
jgi:hypothetical protein